MNLPGKKLANIEVGMMCNERNGCKDWTKKSSAATHRTQPIYTSRHCFHSVLAVVYIMYSAAAFTYRYSHGCISVDATMCVLYAHGVCKHEWNACVCKTLRWCGRLCLCCYTFTFIGNESNSLTAIVCHIVKKRMQTQWMKWHQQSCTNLQSSIACNKDRIPEACPWKLPVCCDSIRRLRSLIEPLFPVLAFPVVVLSRSNRKCCSLCKCLSLAIKLFGRFVVQFKRMCINFSNEKKNTSCILLF